MSKKQKLRQVNEEIFSAKHFFAKNIKRYALIIVIAMPIAMVISFILGNEFPNWYNGAVSFFCSLAMILFACLIGLIIFVKKDEKAKRESTKEKERDPFAD